MKLIVYQSGGTIFVQTICIQGGLLERWPNGKILIGHRQLLFFSRQRGCKRDLLDFFKIELNQELLLFDGGTSRENLSI